MKWLDKLERKYHHLAIPNLMNYIVIITGIVYALIYTNSSIEQKLTLVPSLVLKGEIWRLITFIFIPPTTSLFFIVITLYFYTIIGSTLESIWGSFRFNMYYLIGILGTILASFVGGYATSIYLNLSLFLAFAWMCPNYEIRLFAILPIKVSILSWIYIAMLVKTVIFNPLPEKIVALVSVLNYLLFFGREMIKGTKRGLKTFENRRKFYGQMAQTKDAPIHQCTVCGITEKDDPEMEFRYCSKCAGNHEYCMEHLRNHEHIQQDEAD